MTGPPSSDLADLGRDRRVRDSIRDHGGQAGQTYERITRRSQVQILPPLLVEGAGNGAFGVFGDFPLVEDLLWPVVLLKRPLD